MDILVGLVGQPMAIGLVVKLWRLGMPYWKRDRSLIPKKLFRLVEHADKLLASGWAEEHENGIYCVGARERWDFLLVRSNNGKKRAENGARDGGGRFAPANDQQGTSKQPTNTQQEGCDGPAKTSGIQPSSSSSPSSSPTSSPSSSGSSSSKIPPKPPEGYSEHFEKFWLAYPPEGRLNKAQVWKRYQAQVTSEKLRDDLDTALKNYIEHLRVTGYSCKHASSFLGTTGKRSQGNPWIDFVASANLPKQKTGPPSFAQQRSNSNLNLLNKLRETRRANESR